MDAGANPAAFARPGLNHDGQHADASEDIPTCPDHRDHIGKIFAVQEMGS